MEALKLDRVEGWTSGSDRLGLWGRGLSFSAQQPSHRCSMPCFLSQTQRVQGEHTACQVTLALVGWLLGRCAF